MIEKVNPSHPDKIADRIAGAIVDLAYRKEPDPKVAVEVLIGHGVCHVIIESSCEIVTRELEPIIQRIGGNIAADCICVKQDGRLAANQSQKTRCGDNGIFKGSPLTEEQKMLSKIARDIYKSFPSDGKYILDHQRLIICQSNATKYDLEAMYPRAEINPIGDWSGGTNVDTGATNRKLGSDMADGITGGGLHGKDLSKADVSINIFAFLLAQATGKTIDLCCAIGDEYVCGIPYAVIVETARGYINRLGGFEKFAEWGLF